MRALADSHQKLLFGCWVHKIGIRGKLKEDRGVPEKRVKDLLCLEFSGVK